MLTLILLLARMTLAVMGGTFTRPSRNRRQYIEYYKSVPPVACPNDGTPLLEGPPQEPGILYCPFDFWQYPRDYDPETMAGM